MNEDRYLVGQQDERLAAEYKRGTRDGGVGFQSWYMRKFGTTPLSAVQGLSILLDAIDAAIESLSCADGGEADALESLQQAKEKAEEALNEGTMAT